MDAIQSSLSACTKQQPGNTRENSDSHRVINIVRAQKFSTEKCTQGRVAVNQSMFAFHKLLTGKLTGTPTHFSRQSRTSVNKTPLQEPLGGRPRTAMDSRCRIPPSACRRFPSNPTRTQVRLQAAWAFFAVGQYLVDRKSDRNQIAYNTCILFFPSFSSFPRACVHPHV